MKKNWKGLLAILACGMLVFGAVACGGESSSSSENSLSIAEIGSESSLHATECEHTVAEWIRSNEKTCDIALFYGMCTTCEDVVMVVGREHTYTECGTVEATCTSGGYDWAVCSVCGFEEKSNEVQPLDHDFGEWETYQAATCYFAGEEIRYCKRDGCTHSYYDDTPYHESRIIDALAPNDGHSVANGKCTRCQKTENTDLQFALSGGTYQCIGMGNCEDTDIIIPKTYNNKAVTSIGAYAFYDCDNLTSVEIPDSVTSIGDFAFRYCYDLTSVEIGDNVTSIGNFAFYKCYNLTSIEIGDNVTSIGTLAFYNCNNLTSVKIPNSVTSIGDSAFYDCNILTSVTIGDSVTSIGNSAFYNCYNLTSVEIPDSVTSIGDFAFRYCYDLTSVEIGNNVTSIGEGAFYECDNLTSVKIGDNVTSIGKYAFNSCNNLTSVEIGNNVTRIGDLAFIYCSKLTSVIFADTEGWKAGGTSISSADLEEAGTAAYYLTDKYDGYIWTKQ